MRTTKHARIYVAAALLTACSSSNPSNPMHTSDAGADGDASTGSDAGRSAECQSQDAKVQKVLDDMLQQSSSATNGLVAVKNADCGNTVYISGDPTKATADSLWRIGSVTKTFVSASMLSLVKEGKVALDDPLSKWVPSVSGTTGVTVVMLLDHRSGIFDYLADPTFDQTKPWTPQQIVDFATVHAPYFAPDAGWHYSNTNYILLGMILEAATGQKAGAVLHERAIDIAKLQNTFFDSFDKVDPSRMARGNRAGMDVTFLDDPSAWWTCGAMVESGSDLADWVATLYGSETVLDASQQALLSSKTSDQSAAWGCPASYGLGVFFLDSACWPLANAGPALGHGGAVTGFCTDAWYFPDKKTAIVSTVNAFPNNCDDADSVARKAVAALFP